MPQPTLKGPRRHLVLFSTFSGASIFQRKENVPKTPPTDCSNAPSACRRATAFLQNSFQKGLFFGHVTLHLNISPFCISCQEAQGKILRSLAVISSPMRLRWVYLLF